MHAEGFGIWVSGFGCVGNFVGDFEGRVRGCMAGSGVVFRLSDYAFQSYADFVFRYCGLGSVGI